VVKEDKMLNRSPPYFGGIQRKHHINKSSQIPSNELKKISEQLKKLT
jgi:hypothetical protein